MNPPEVAHVIDIAVRAEKVIASFDSGLISYGTGGAARMINRFRWQALWAARGVESTPMRRYQTLAAVVARRYRVRCWLAEGARDGRPDEADDA
jgi:hypothetical protein